MVLAWQIDVCPITVSPNGHSRTQTENAAAAHLVYPALHIACSTPELSAVCLYAALYATEMIHRRLPRREKACADGVHSTATAAAETPTLHDTPA